MFKLQVGVNTFTCATTSIPSVNNFVTEEHFQFLTDWHSLQRITATMAGMRKSRNNVIHSYFALSVLLLLISKCIATPLPDQPAGSCCFTRLVAASGLGPGDFWVNITAVGTSASAVSRITVTFSGAAQMAFPASPMLPSSKSASCERIGNGFMWSCLDRTVDFRVLMSGSTNASLPSASVQLEGNDCSLQGVCNLVPTAATTQDDGMWDMGLIGRQPKWLMILCGVLIILIVGGGVIAIWRRRYGSGELKAKRYSRCGLDGQPQDGWNGAGSSSKPDSFLGRRPTIARELYEKNKSSGNSSSEIEDRDSMEKSSGSSLNHRSQLDTREPDTQAFPAIGGVPSQGGYSFTSESVLSWNAGAAHNGLPPRLDTRKASFDSARTAADREPSSGHLTRTGTYISPGGESPSRLHLPGISRSDTQRRTGPEDVSSTPRGRTLLEENELQRQQLLLLSKLPSLAAAAVTPTSGVKPLVDISEMSLSLSTTAIERSASEKILRQQSKKKNMKTDEGNRISQQLQLGATGSKNQVQRSSSTVKANILSGEALDRHESIASGTTHHTATEKMHRSATTKSPKRSQGSDRCEPCSNGADALKRSATTTASSKASSDINDDEDIPLWKVRIHQLGGGDDDEVPLSEVLARSMNVHRPFGTPNVGG
ncbi:hypothetical protein BJ742DRAFT_806943 [Cladochytrium replicatum]|nr:hypothetical protein BJ742DRAFT_806943 [Cladochytrium replicatum]